MTDEDGRRERREALEAAVWRSGYRGDGEELETVLDALADWMDLIAEDRTAKLSQEVDQVQVSEIDDLQRQINELSVRLEEHDGKHAGPVWSFEGAEEPEDPYGDALLAAIEEEQALQYRDADTLDALYAEVREHPDENLVQDPDLYPRRCRTCGVPKAKEEFKIDKSMRGGRRSDCKPCVRKRDKDREERKRNGR